MTLHHKYDIGWYVAVNIERGPESTIQIPRTRYAVDNFQAVMQEHDIWRGRPHTLPADNYNEGYDSDDISLEMIELEGRHLSFPGCNLDGLEGPI